MSNTTESNLIAAAGNDAASFVIRETDGLFTMTLRCDGLSAVVHSAILGDWVTQGFLFVDGLPMRADLCAAIDAAAGMAC